MQIRKATLKDAQRVSELWTEFHKEHDSNIIKKNKRAAPQMAKRKDARQQFEKYVRKCIRSKDSMVNVAVDNGKIVAYSLVLIKKNTPVFEIRKMGYFADLFVQKPYRGQGISSQFRDIAIRWFKQKGLKFMSIMVYPDNTHAHEIYKKWGFFDLHMEMRSKI